MLDWGDAAHCWRVTELAVATTYAMLLAVPGTAEPAGSVRSAPPGAPALVPEQAARRWTACAVAGGSAGGGAAPPALGSRQAGPAGGPSAAEVRGAVLAAGRDVVGGYLAAGGRLEPAERALLPELIRGRVALSLVNGAAAAAAAAAVAGAAAGNEGYVLLTQRPGWTALRALGNAGGGELAAALVAEREERVASG